MSPFFPGFAHREVPGMSGPALATMLYGLSSGAALATVVGVLIEVPLMLALVKFCLKTKAWFPAESPEDAEMKEPSEPELAGQH